MNQPLLNFDLALDLRVLISLILRTGDKIFSHEEDSLAFLGEESVFRIKGPAVPPHLTEGRDVLHKQVTICLHLRTTPHEKSQSKAEGLGPVKCN